MDCRLYKLTHTPLEKACAKLLEKIYASGRHVHVFVKDDAEAESLATVLWTYHPRSFLPHGTEKDGNPENQPIWISPHLENLNQAEVLVLFNLSQAPEFEGYAQCIDVFSGDLETSLDHAKSRYHYYKTTKKADIICWGQDDKGNWHQVKDDETYFQYENPLKK